MTRYCPKCGEPVPSNCITCPKCYTKIPAEPVSAEETKRSEPKRKSQSTRILLTVIPGLFGLLGLGILYDDTKNMLGYKFLIAGLLLFILGNVLILTPGFLTTVLGIGPMIVYLILFLITILRTLLNVNVVFRHA